MFICLIDFAFIINFCAVGMHFICQATCTLRFYVSKSKLRFELVAQVWLKYCAPLFYIWFCNILAFNKVMTIDEQVKLN